MKREIKIGIFAVLMMGCAWAGIRFLSGIDIFSRNVEYYATYDRINGVQPASPIMIKGVKVGSVTGISFDPAQNHNVVLQLTLKRQYRIPSNSEAKIFSNGIMGAKAVEISLGNATTYLQGGDTLLSSRDRDLMDVAGSELDFFKQKFAQIVDDLSKTLGNIDLLLESNAQNVAGTLSHLNTLTGDAAGILSSEKADLKRAISNLAQFTDMLGGNAARMDSIIGNVNRVTTQLSEGEFVQHLNATVADLNATLAKINKGDGTIGKLMNDPQLYASLNEASGNLAVLLADLKAHPGRYVHLSLFGRSDAKLQAKEVKKAAKAAEKAKRDSLRMLK
ncbi:MAG: MlaD family protein [Alistipes sp.]